MQLPMTDCPEAEGTAAERTAVIVVAVTRSLGSCGIELHIAYNPSFPPSLPPSLSERTNERMDGWMDDFFLMFDDNTEQTTTARGTTRQDRTGGDRRGQGSP